ncbi:MAG: alanine--glyoxylate aminotransferase family protein [Campylobacterales bacterium]|nr:alanine--glyoxylate aminotransferase family protein [Campylobacterales bacterium]
MLLFTPGPTPVPQNVRNAMSDETMHHRTPEFEAIFEKTRKHLFKVFNTDEVVMLSSSGTGAMEAAVINLCHNTLLNVNSGKFGERFGKIALANGLKNVEIKNEWDTAVSVEAVVEAIKNNSDIDAIAVQISESAGGLRHPVEEIAKAVKEINPNIMIIADGITAVGVEKIDVTNIDCILAGSQKAFMLPPGLSMMGLSQRALDKIGKGKGYYFNLATEIKSQRKNTTAWTAATTLIIGLLEIFETIERDGGLEKLYKDTALRAEAVQSALESIGLHVYPHTPAKSMTTIDDADASVIRKMLKNNFSVNVAGGQDHLEGKIFRINQMGLIPVYEMAWVVNSIELVLSKLGRRAYDGSANKVFNQILFENIQA